MSPPRTGRDIKPSCPPTTLRRHGPFLRVQESRPPGRKRRRTPERRQAREAARSHRPQEPPKNRANSGVPRDCFQSETLGHPMVPKVGPRLIVPVRFRLEAGIGLGFPPSLHSVRCLRDSKSRQNPLIRCGQTGKNLCSFPVIQEPVGRQCRRIPHFPNSFPRLVYITQHGARLQTKPGEIARIRGRHRWIPSSPEDWWPTHRWPARKAHQGKVRQPVSGP